MKSDDEQHCALNAIDAPSHYHNHNPLHANANNNINNPVAISITDENKVGLNNKIVVDKRRNHDLHNIQNTARLKREMSSTTTNSPKNVHNNHKTKHKNKRKTGTVSNMWDILSLPDDVLYMIFSFLNPSDLCKICSVCKRFNFLSCKDCVWSQNAEQNVLVDFPLDKRRRQTYSLKEKCRLAPNWRDGKFKDRYIVRHKVRQIPWIQKDGQDMWFSTGNVIRCFKCQPNSGHLKENKNKCLSGLKYDVTRFVIKDNMTVAGSLDGSVYGWNSSGESLFHHKQVHESDIHCVDFTDRCVISGSKDGYCKVTPLQLQGSKTSGTLCCRKFKAGERVWCLQSSPCQSFFVAGLAGCLDSPPLVMWDIESGEFLGHLSCDSKRGAGVLHMKFESANELLTCGYDTFIRLWDMRMRSCVRQWEEPYDSSLYCLETDGANAMAVGTNRHGMVRMWDKRNTQPVQMYYSTVGNSPVYSLAMDYSHLYLALDMGLSVMDFT